MMNSAKSLEFRILESVWPTNGVIRTASDDSCGGRPGTRLQDQHCIPVGGFLGISPLKLIKKF